MNPTTAFERPVSPAVRDARIDWAKGRLIGFSVPEGAGDAFDVVQLHLDGLCVLSAVANLSVFDLARDLAGLTLPSREQSGFELQIPSGSLHPGLVRDAVVHLEVKTSRGEPIFDYYLAGLHDLLRLADSPPVDLLFEVRIRVLSAGSLYGKVVDKHRTGLRPALQARVNDLPPEPLSIYETSADGAVHLFSVPVRPDRLIEGSNQIKITAFDGQVLALYPIQFGAPDEGDTARRVAALEAEMGFLKRVVLSQNLEALPARLALLKGEVVGICSEMLTLQRMNFEREVFASPDAAKAVSTTAPTAAEAPAEPASARGKSAVRHRDTA
jgi:hypothetical protein